MADEPKTAAEAFKQAFVASGKHPDGRYNLDLVDRFAQALDARDAFRLKERELLFEADRVAMEGDDE